MATGVLLPVGFVMVAAALAIDYWIRLRMREIGRKSVFLLGGFFNYNEYIAAGRKYGWSLWPLHLMYLLLVGGIVCGIVGAAVKPRG